MKTKFFVLLLLVTISSASAVTIAGWTFENGIDATGVQTPASVNPNATATVFALSSGSVSFFGGNAPTATTAISGIGWNVLDGVKWWEFTVAASSGFELDLSSLTFDDRASGTGATRWSVTVNGVPAASSQATHAAFSSNPMNTVSLSALAFQDLSSAVVKISGSGASGATGTWRLDNVSLNGEVAKKVLPVPDTGTTVALLILPLLGLCTLRRFAVPPPTRV